MSEICPLGNYSPDGADGVMGDERVGCEDGEFVLDGLADQYAIEGIFVQRREFGVVRIIA